MLRSSAVTSALGLLVTVSVVRTGQLGKGIALLNEQEEWWLGCVPWPRE